MKRPALIALAFVPLLLAAERPRPEPRPAARQVGEPVSCIQLGQIRESRVRDDWTIDFVRDGKRAWRNNLRTRCPGLRAANAITYETSLSQLCSTDIVYTLETTPDVRRGPACNIGEFVPVELER